MNTPTIVALITISSLSFIASATTLTVVLVGAKKMQTQLDEVKTKTNKTVSNLKSALATLEF
jgi:hypothetical protein